MTRYKFLQLIATILLVGCAVRNNLSPDTPTAQDAVGAVSATATPSIQAQREEILRQIRQAAASYNSFVEDEKKTGTYDIVNLGDGKCRVS